MSDREVAERISAAFVLPPSWPHTDVEELRSDVTRLAAATDSLDVLASLEAIRAITDRLPNIAGDILEVAAAQTTITQKRLAEALGVKPSMLRGLRS